MLKMLPSRPNAVNIHFIRSGVLVTEIVKISQWLLFLSSYRVRIFVALTLYFKAPPSKSRKVLNQGNVRTKVRA
jgi:hypothetical protein